MDRQEEIAVFTQKLCQQCEGPDEHILLHIKLYTVINVFIYLCSSVHVHSYTGICLSVLGRSGDNLGELVL